MLVFSFFLRGLLDVYDVQDRRRGGPGEPDVVSEVPWTTWPKVCACARAEKIGLP